MRKHFLLLTASALLLLPGCLKTFREAEPRLEVDRSELTVRAKSGSGYVKDTLYVSSNRSWSAVVTEGADWLDVGEGGFENPAEVFKTAPLPLLCKDNSVDEERSGKVLIIGAGLNTEVTVTQKALHGLTEADVTDILPYTFEDFGTL